MNENNFTKGEIDRLGERLKKDEETDEDLKLLDTYRSSFDDAFLKVITLLREIVDKEKRCILNDRETKTRQSIKNKLKRIDGMKLSRMQDIRGCRIVIDGGLTDTSNMSEKINATFKEKIKAKTKDDEIGYRATHIILEKDNKNVEIQLRTLLQDQWANLCEKFSTSDYDLKYGTRNAEIKNTLKRLSELIKAFEKKEYTNAESMKEFKKRFIFFKGKKHKNLLHEQKQLMKIREEIIEVFK